MHQTGVTTDSRPVIAGVFPLVGTHGIPLELVLADFEQRGFVIDWPDYIERTLMDGHKPRTVKGRILAAVGDMYAGKHAQAVAVWIHTYTDHDPTLKSVGKERT